MPKPFQPCKWFDNFDNNVLQFFQFSRIKKYMYNGVAMDVELQTFVGLSPIMPNDKRNSESVTVSLFKAS